MIYSGLVSITFRNLSPKEIINMVQNAGMKGIEWGGDIHVPPRDIKNAGEVLQMTRDAGLSVAAYGSYYRVGCPEANPHPFESILETAAALEAPIIRVWPGMLGSAEVDAAYRENVVADTQRICELAVKAGIKIAYEYHPDTLTDTAESAVSLIKSVNHENLSCYWQPPVGMEPDDCLEGIDKIQSWLSNIHVFHWRQYDKLPLEEGIDNWKRYMEQIQKVPGDRYAMIEFVKDGECDQFYRDAEALKQLLREIRK